MYHNAQTLAKRHCPSCNTMVDANVYNKHITEWCPKAIISQTFSHHYDALLVGHDKGDCHQLMHKLYIYPGLLACTYIHLKLCVRDGARLIEELRQMLEHWKQTNIDYRLTKQSTIEGALKQYIGQGGSRHHHHCPATTYSPATCDILIFRAILESYLTEHGWEKRFCEQRDAKAQDLVNIMQLVLNDHSTIGRCRHRVLAALVRLSRKSSKYPRHLQLRIAPSQVHYNLHSRRNGGFGEVYQGSIGQQLVAVKKVRTNASEPAMKCLKHFASEAVVWKNLHHPNILPFHGIVGEGLDICLISPWMQNGNVRTFFADQRYRSIDRVLYMLDIAQGLHYLHSLKPPVIHGDLKGDNVLVNGDLRACLSDFGVTSTDDSRKFLDSSTARLAASPERWLAPEIMVSETGNCTAFADMYAFGMVCYEIYSGTLPFNNIRDQHVYQYVQRGGKPERPPAPGLNLRNDIWDFIERECWNQQSERRPTASHAVHFMNQRCPHDTRPPSHWNVGLPSSAYTG